MDALLAASVGKRITYAELTPAANASELDDAKRATLKGRK